jgi:hypothetical protein
MQAGTRHDRAQRGGLAVSANEAGDASCISPDAYLEGVYSIGFLNSGRDLQWHGWSLHAASVVLYYCCMPVHRRDVLLWLVRRTACMLRTTVMNRSSVKILYFNLF